MPKFRKKPVIIEAEQWWPGSQIAGVYYDTEYVTEDLDGERVVRDGAYVVTIHGQRVYIEAGDWIISEPDGIHFYSCQAAIFAATYEPVEADA